MAMPAIFAGRFLFLLYETLMGGKQLQSVFVLKIDDAVQPQDRNLAAADCKQWFPNRHIAADK